MQIQTQKHLVLAQSLAHLRQQSPTFYVLVRDHINLIICTWSEHAPLADAHWSYLKKVVLSCEKYPAAKPLFRAMLQYPLCGSFIKDCAILGGSTNFAVLGIRTIGVKIR